MEKSGLKSRAKVIRRNFILAVLNGIITNSANGFVNATVIIPVFINSLTSAKWIIGMLSGLEGAGWFLPQFFIANLVEHLPRKKWLYTLMMYLRVAFFLLAGIIVFLSTKASTTITISCFTVSMALFYLASGVSGLPFLSIISSTIPPERRGSLWAYRIFFGSILVTLASLLVKPILQNWSFPTNYSILFLLSGITMFIGFFLFTLSWEPKLKNPPPKKPLPSYLKETIDTIKTNKDFRSIMYFRASLALWGISVPFYVIFATNYLDFAKSNVGLLFAVMQVGTTATVPLWGWISDHKGNRLVLIGCSISGLLVPVLSLVGGVFQSVSTFAIYTAFILMGIIMGGSWMAYTNYVMEIAPPKRTPMFLGFMNTFTGFLMLLSPLGGLLADLTDIRVLFIISILGGFLMLILSIRLREPRLKKHHHNAQ